MRLRFGTDGIRGVANTELSASLSLAVGEIVGRVLVESSAKDPLFLLTKPASAGILPLVLIGEDTRRSSPMLRAALSAGLAANGVDVVSLGVVPTGAVAILVREMHAIGGAMVSASHNPSRDNGLKFFGMSGQKLTDPQQARIEAELDKRLDGQPETRPDTPVVGSRFRNSEIGMVSVDDGLVDKYLHALLQSVETPLSGLRVVIDAANGSAFRLGARVLREAGAEVETLFDVPDGGNINASCGATAPHSLARVVVDRGADIGLAFDGDADRLIAVDEQGAVVDGDGILAVLALALHEKGTLGGDAIVATVMSNVGLSLALRSYGIGVRECAVGDRNVLLSLEKEGLYLGGEQSGHVIFRHLAPTGCGLLTALQLCQRVVMAGVPLSELAGVMTKYPQILRNVDLEDRARCDEAKDFWREVESVRSDLGEVGRLVVRPSGTEPKLRIMAQAPTEEAAEAAVARIEAALAYL